mmetsp:Transcript_44488/g.85101  ORF Transcript_44488/g.85101 Transcript_44488/m.85101 type:complete len:380 (+) Transcript_44488:57-1196(+)
MGAFFSMMMSFADTVTSTQVYRNFIFNAAWLINRPAAIWIFFFSEKARAKAVNNTIVFSPDGADSIVSSTEAFQANQLSWADWANVTATPKDKSEEAFTQVGGHEGAFEAGGNTVKKLAGKAELAFYEDLKKAQEAGDLEKSWPTAFMPQYYGNTSNSAGKKQIVLENLLQGFKQPCIMDLKVGTETVDATSNTKKIFRMMWRDTLTGSAIQGVKLVALSVFHPRTEATTVADKKQAESIAKDATLESILAYFLSDGDRVRRHLLAPFLDKLNDLLAAFEQQKHFHFIGSSLLFVYEGDPEALRAQGLTHKCELRMIDFAHVFSNHGAVDTGYITGIKALIKAFQTISHAKHLQSTDTNHIKVLVGLKRWQKRATTNIV